MGTVVVYFFVQKVNGQDRKWPYSMLKKSVAMPLKLCDEVIVGSGHENVQIEFVARVIRQMSQTNQPRLRQEQAFKTEVVDSLCRSQRK